MRCNTECGMYNLQMYSSVWAWVLKRFESKNAWHKSIAIWLRQAGANFLPAAGMSVSMILTVNRLLVTKAITCLVRSWATLTHTRPFSKRKHAHSLTWVTPGWRVLLSNGHDRLMFIPRKKRKDTRVIASLLIIVAQQIAVIQVSSDELLSLRWKNL